MDDLTFAKAVERKVTKSFSRSSLVSEDYYQHPTFVVRTLAEYMDLVSKISSVLSMLTCGDTVIYRGVPNKEYELTPSLSRIPEHPDVEQAMINDFITRRPDAFRGLNEFDMLAKMQHYGLPTRLLDFSINPLVALYFACESLNSSNGHDGRVVCHCAFLQNDTAPLVNALCRAIFEEPFDPCYSVDNYICSEAMPLNKYMLEVYLCKELTVVRPKYWNQRIANQAGVFVVFPNNLSDRYKSILVHAGDIGIEQAINQYGRGEVSSELIEQLSQSENLEYYKELDSSVVTDEYVQQIAAAHKSKDNRATQWDLHKNRFIMCSDLKPISQDMINDSFCSITIEKNSKRRILQELSYVGIGADYIYPELEYTAKEIKRQYGKKTD